jgi:hypothetical protein
MTQFRCAFPAIVIGVFAVIGCGAAFKPGVLFKPGDKRIRYTGRIDFSNPQKPRMAGAGSAIRFAFRGRSCDVLFENGGVGGNHGYIAVVIDGEYRGRMKVAGNRTVYALPRDLNDGDHSVLICKATEAMTGSFDFLGIVCPELRKPKNMPKRKIEFIGNSITCGTGLDLSEMPCGRGAWHDQHNAYLAYGPVTARRLKADWLLSSVSGIGVTRTWSGHAGGVRPYRSRRRLFLFIVDGRPIRSRFDIHLPGNERFFGRRRRPPEGPPRFGPVCRRVCPLHPSPAQTPPAGANLPFVEPDAFGGERGGAETSSRIGPVPMPA